MRRITTALLSLILLLSVTQAALAQTDVLVIEDGLRGADNTGGTVAISLTNTGPIAGLQLTLLDEPDLLEITAIRVTDRAEGVFDVAAFHGPGDGSETLLALSTDPANTLAPGEGTVLEVDYALASGAPPGTIRLRPADVFVVDTNGQRIPMELQDGTFFDPQVTAFREFGKAAGFEQLFNFTCCPDAFGAAWADYDLDGDEDLLHVGFFTALFRNNGDGTFTEVGEASGVRTAVTFDVGLSPVWGDYDNDGDPDAFILAQSGDRVLLENAGDGTFSDVTAAAGLVVQSEGAFSANWVDFNNDGHLDLYTSDGFLFRNNKDKTFSNVTDATGVGSATASGTAWADYDHDGDADLFAADGLFRNDSGMFVNVTESTGVSPGVGFGGGTAWGDFNNDGGFDLYVTRSDFMPASLYRNDGDGTFTDVTASAGVGVDLARGVAWADMDLDGDLDLFVTRPAVPEDPYRLFRNDGDGTFSDVAALASVVIDSWFFAGISDEPGQAASWADVNGDGTLDLFVANGRPPQLLFENRGNGTGNHFISIKLVGTDSNRSGIGARVTVETGGLAQIREVEGGANTAQNSLPVEFGLGQADEVDRIVIQWPSGLVEAKTDPTPANQFLTLVEGTLTPTGVRSDASPELPPQVRLHPNYPNPFGTSTRIGYDLPLRSRVTIKVYNVLGQEVATLLDEERLAGSHHLIWDGTSGKGVRASSGLYLVRMTAGAVSHSLKMIVIR
ncbi:MAG: FG-GAP-like repeat-containing protein [Rhodothermales bacterium]